MSDPVLRPLRTDEEARAAGRAARATVPRSALGELVLPASRDPLAVLEQQNESRQQDLVDLRWQRILADPFAFYRGTAAIMAADLAAGPSTDLTVIACGDAHLGNFGFYGSPQRTLVFDLNDFDEAGLAPWEWDVKRLATSAAMGAQQNGATDAEALEVARATARAYREQLREVARLTVLERYHALAEAEGSRYTKQAQHVLDDAIRSARRRTSDRVARRLMSTAADGSRQFLDDPPVLMRVTGDRSSSEELLLAYGRTIEPNTAVLLSQYALDDAARRVVGVGSVGTRCYLLAFRGPSGEPLVLQLKQALPSVLESHGGRPQLPGLGASGTPARESRRVVTHQRVLQAVSDRFLGYFGVEDRDYYVRQFHDMKGGIEFQGLALPEFVTYVEACARVLAAAHGRSPEVAAIAGYLGKGKAFDNALAVWSVAYAAQARRDFEDVRAAVEARL